MIEAVQLTKKYGQFLALDNFSIKVNKGEIYCLLGANGAGKTTTINLFLNFISPSDGEARICGLNVVANPVESKKYISYIPENLILYPYLSGLENLDFFCGLSNLKYSKDELECFLEDVGLQNDFINKRTSCYSKGMKQKIGIALANAKDAKVLLLDEPTSGLDPKASNDFGEMLQLMRGKGVAVLMATHDLFRAKEIGTHLCIMKQGELQNLIPSQDISIKELEAVYLNHMRN